MKKFFKWLIIILLIIVAILYFTTTEYFFNKFIAPKIKEYNFSYNKVNGDLLNGFEVYKLKYKGTTLSDSVKLKFNPIKLIDNKIYISKLKLKNVNVNLLQKVLEDFKSKSNKKRSENNNINFELNNIDISAKPFNIKDIHVQSAKIKVYYISYVNSVLDMGDSEYNFDTDIGKISFIGKFNNRVLNIDSMDIRKLKVDRLKQYRYLLDSKQDSNKTKDSNKSDSGSNIMPKVVIAKDVKLSLAPFELEGFDSKHLSLRLKNLKLDLNSSRLVKSDINIIYKSSMANLLVLSKVDNKSLHIKKIKAHIFKPEKIVSLINKMPNSESNNSDTLFEAINIDKLSFKCDQYNYKNSKIDNLNFNINNLNYNVKSNFVKSDMFNLNMNSSFGSISSKGSLDSKLTKIDNLTLKNLDIKALNKIFASDESNKEKSSSKEKILFINKVLINNFKLNLARYKTSSIVINSGEIDAKSLLVNLKKSTLVKANVKVKANTNWGLAFLNGKIDNSVFIAKGEADLNSTFYNMYKIPVISKNIKPITVDGKFSLDKIDVIVGLSGKEFLKDFKELDLIKSKNHVVYNMNNGDVSVDTKGKFFTQYTKSANIENKFIYLNRKNTFNYTGKIHLLETLSTSSQMNSLLEGAEFFYKGDKNYIEAKLSSKLINATLKDNGYKGGILKITNNSSILLSQLFKLDGYKGASMNKLSIEAPIDFNSILPIKGKVSINSNLVNINGNFEYKNNISSKLKITLPSSSLLKSKEVKLNSLFPLNIDIKQIGALIDVKVKGLALASSVNYNSKNQYIKALASLKGLKLDLNGNIDNLKFKVHTSSLKNAIAGINSILYNKLELNIDGAISVNGSLKKSDKIELSIKSPKLTYKSKGKPTIIKDITLNISKNKESIVLNNYRFTTSGYKLYSTKPSLLSLGNSVVNIKTLWVNNSLNINGNYNIENSRGVLNLNSNGFKIENSDASGNISVKSKISINKEKISISGDINILSAVIKKNLAKKRVADNEDIIILQQLREKKSKGFTKNVKLNLNIKSSKPIVYRASNSNFKLKPKMKIIKNFNSFMVIKGEVTLVKPSYYLLGKKRVYLKKGKIVFKGKKSTPYLNIVMHYKGAEVDVFINISGSSNRPVIFFSSNPPLTKTQILAYLLFDDTSAVGTHSQEEMLGVISGTLAKSFLGSIGIKVDHLSIRENGFSIGKNIGKHIIIYYSQDEENPSVKTRINISKSVHTEIEISDKKQSADIIFSKEY